MLTYGYNREEIIHSVVNRMYDARYATYMLLGTKEPEVLLLIDSVDTSFLDRR